MLQMLSIVSKKENNLLARFSDEYVEQWAERAEAEAEYIKTLTEQLGKEEVSKVMMLDKVLAAYKAISCESSNKIYNKNKPKGGRMT